MIVGFTGTSLGMTGAQADAIRRELRRCICHAFGGEPGQLHHGDCVGADSQAHDLAIALGYLTHSHPPTNENKRAHKKADVIHVTLPYLTRNKQIVLACDVLLAAPGGPEKLRSGTWSTVRYARKMHKSITIVMPDGSTHFE